MTWIDDVVTHTTIRSVWGNTIRDRVVHQFASKAERDAATVVPVEGMMCQLADSGFVYVRRQNAWWVLAMPAAPYTPAAWGSPANTAVSPLAVPSGSGTWWQAMGIAHCRAAYQVDMGGLVAVPAWIFVNTPVTVAAAGPTGPVRITVNATGNAFGGWSTWYDNNTGGAQGSRCLVGSLVGGSTAVINVPSGSPLISVEVDMTFPCVPTVDG